MISRTICRTAAFVGLLTMTVSPAFSEEKAKGHDAHHAAPAVAKPATKAVAVLSPTEGNKVSGTVTFTKQDDGVLVEAQVEGLSANGKHGFHIHEFGDISSPDGSAAGGHFNPTGAPHGAPDDEQRHAGDFGNLEADENGKAAYSRVDKHLEFDGPGSFLGHAVIVHASPDDLKSQPSGNAGARIAQGVVGVAKAAE